MTERKPLPIAVPEEIGISSSGILRFLDKLEKNRLNMHSYILLRHGKIVSEGYWKPFSADKLHRMYSISKTFTSAAIGALADEGKITLEDRVVSFFADKLPEKLYPHVAEMTVRDLLMMATPYSYPTYGLQFQDWAWTFFNTPTSHPAGTVFAYDTSGSFILNVIVERVTGMPFLEYLKLRMLDEIGFSSDAWCVKSPEGYSWGGSGVMCTTRDLAKFALIFMNGGQYNGKQLLSKEYVSAATARQIDNKTSGFCDESCDGFGYGYQIWRTRDNSYSFLGMGDQLAICIPEKDILFVCTADNQGYGASRAIIYNSLWDHIVYPACDTAQKADDAAYHALTERNAALVPTPTDGAISSACTEKVNNIPYTLYNNPMKITRTKLTFAGDRGVWEYSNFEGDKRIEFGLGKVVEGKFPCKRYFGDTIGVPAGREYGCLASAAWVEENKFLLKIFVIDDYFGNMAVTFSFKGDEIGIFMTKTAEWFLDEYQGFAAGEKSIKEQE